MSDIFILAGLLLGIFGLGPLVAWLIGLFNPIGYLGYPPWDPRVKAAREQARRELSRSPRCYDDRKRNGKKEQMNQFSYVMNPVTDEVKHSKDLKDGDVAIVQDASIPAGRTGQLYRISGLHSHDGYLHWVGTYEDGYQRGFVYGRHVPFIVRKTAE